MDYTILVNKSNKLDNDFFEREIKPNLVEFKTTKNNEIVFKYFGIDEKKTIIEKKTAEKFKDLQEFAKKNNILIDVTSGYLSLVQQQKKYDYFVSKKGEEWAKKSACLPGYSEHNTGLAIDFDIFLNGKWGGIALDENGNTNKYADWIHEHLHEFGFILRYPRGKEDITEMKFEPWHIRYVGNELAEYIYKNRITLEEYYSQKD